MKKFLTILAIATATVATVAITQSAAHYIRRCRMNHCLPVRKTTNRVFPFNSHQLRRQIAREARIRKNMGNKFVFWRNYNRQISRGFVKQNYTTYKLGYNARYSAGGGPMV